MKIRSGSRLLAAALLVASASPASVLPIRIAVDRCHDTQWTVPGHPVLDVRSLRAPVLDQADCRAGYYTFETDGGGNVTRFVRVVEEGPGAPAVRGIYDSVDFLVVSDDVLFFNGNPSTSVAGGGYGTLIQGSNIPASDAAASYDTVPVEGSGISPTEWLLDNFQDSDDSAVCPESGGSSGDDGGGDGSEPPEGSAASRVDAFLWKTLVALVLCVAMKA